MNKKLLKTNILRLGLGLVLVILINQSFIPSLSIQQLERNYWPTEGWQLSTPKGMNMSQSRLNDMIVYIEEQEFAIDSILIVKNGYIVFEEYLNPTQNESTLHPIFSCTKSYMSAFIGLAIEKGYFESIDQKIFDFFPNQTYSNPDPRKQNITIQHLLTMTSGLEWTEWDLAFTDPNNDLAHLIDSSNWVQYILDKPMAVNPGTVFNYNTGDFHLLSALLMNATAAQNVSIENFLVDSFGAPMGSSGFGWEVDPQRIPTGGTGMHASIREMAKFGFLYLNNGTWDNKQVIPKEWITLSTSNHTTVNGNSSYGHGWWVRPDLNLYYASGFAGQLIIPVQQHDMVVVFTSSEETNWPYLDLLTEYIYTSIEVGADPDISINGFLFIDVIFGSVIVLIGIILKRRSLSFRIFR